MEGVYENSRHHEQVQKTEMLYENDLDAIKQCGNWLQESLIDLAKEQTFTSDLLVSYQLFIILSIFELLYLSISIIVMPTAGMHIVNDYLVSDIGWIWVIFWAPNLLNLILLGALMDRVESNRARLVIIWSLFIICYRIIFIILFFTTGSSRQERYNIGHALSYWFELIFNLGIIFSSIAIISRMDPLMNKIKPLDEVVAENNQSLQYLGNGNNNNISFQDLTQHNLRRGDTVEGQELNQQDKNQMIRKNNIPSNLFQQANLAKENGQKSPNAQTIDEPIIDQNWRSQFCQYAPIRKKRRVNNFGISSNGGKNDGQYMNTFNSFYSQIDDDILRDEHGGSHRNQESDAGSAQNSPNKSKNVQIQTSIYLEPIPEDVKIQQSRGPIRLSDYQNKQEGNNNSVMPGLTLDDRQEASRMQDKSGAPFQQSQIIYDSAGGGGGATENQPVAYYLENFPNPNQKQNQNDNTSSQNGEFSVEQDSRNEKQTSQYKQMKSLVNYGEGSKIKNKRFRNLNNSNIDGQEDGSQIQKSYFENGIVNENYYDNF